MSHQTPYRPPVGSLVSTNIDIRDPHYEELVDLEKVFPISPKINKLVLESISPRRLCFIKKSFACKSASDITNRRNDRQVIPRLESPNSNKLRKIRKKLKRANSTMQNTLIPIDRLLLHAENHM
mmetsp:Transcript_6451/g.10552  ORF Transcript_6451/g.10552 Transcript_6451/m.10552 type:complete len:124 (-) Transcript_6451:437-808(-)